MLQKIRDNVQGTIAKLIIAAIAVPFALFGIDAFFTGGVPKVAKVNGEEVTESDLSYAIDLQRRRLLAQMQDKVDPSLLEESKLRTPVLESLIERLVLRQEAMATGLRVSDAMLNQIILSESSFQENGSFSQTRFEALLAGNGMSPAVYRKMLREEVLISQLLNGLSISEFVSPAELREVARITGQSVDVRYLNIPLESNSEILVPEGDILTYYEEHKADFMTEEKLSVEYLELNLQDLYQPVAEEQVRKEFERRIANFEGQTERHVAHIMLMDMPDEEAMEKLSTLRARILAGEDFATLAKENSQDVGSAESGGDLGFTAGDAFPQEFEQAAATLKPGDVSEPVKSEAGWHLIKLIEERKQDQPRYADLRGEIEQELQRRDAEPLFVERSEKLADLSFNSESLQEAAAELGLTIKTSASFGRRGGEGVFADPRVVASAFSKDVLEDSQNSELLELSKENVLVLRLAGHEAARQRDLAEVRDSIDDALKMKMRRDRASEKAQTLLAELRAGQSVEVLATAGGHEWQVALKHRRGAPDLDVGLDQAVFQAARPQGSSVYGQHVKDNGDILLFEVHGFHQGSLDEMPPAQQQALRDAYRQAKGSEVVNLYQKNLRESATVELL